MNTYIGLVHYPIYNRNGAVITTAIANFDIHDLARTARTYNIAKYFIIHPIESQVKLAEDVMGYWQTGFGKEYNPDRNEAFRIVTTAPDIAEVIAQITEQEGKKPIVVTTDARIYPNSISYPKLRHTIETGDRPCLLLFGTGFGMEKSLMNQFDYILEPIYGGGEYNHLPVRSAVAIILDRLLGEAWWQKNL
ncbi:MAG: RNA methyltransferase [Sporomusaceae bacterium]|nr:RNA methyltransferase [Sporomusaceae bacterium]